MTRREKLWDLIGRFTLPPTMRVRIDDCQPRMGPSAARPPLPPPEVHAELLEMSQWMGPEARRFIEDTVAAWRRESPGELPRDL
jgi:hypothetical protein